MPRDQLAVGKRRRSVAMARLGAIILGETNRRGHWSVLRLTVLKLKLVLGLGDDLCMNAGTCG